MLVHHGLGGPLHLALLRPQRSVCESLAEVSPEVYVVAAASPLEGSSRGRVGQHTAAALRRDADAASTCNRVHQGRGGDAVHVGFFPCPYQREGEREK